MRTRTEAKKAKEEIDQNPSTRVDGLQPVEQLISEEVAKLSGQLRDELTPKPPPFEFQDANRRPAKPLRADLQRVVETVYVKDIHEEWKVLEEGLQLGEKRSEHAHAIAALDKASARAYRAHRLYLTARAARDDWEAENETYFAAMLEQATKSLQHEKDTGVRSKQITDQDVRARVAVLFPEEYKAQERRRRNVENTVKSLERLAELWLNRCRDLQALVGKLR